jgi:hypothetical protein
MAESDTAWNKTHRILKIWTHVMTHVRMRDRSIKILQYGSQMLLGFYGGKLSSQARSQLTSLRGQSSTSRKAFWLLKSITQIDAGMQMINNGYLTEASSLAEKLDFLENLFLIWYYFTESQIFFARADGMFGQDEGAIDFYVNLSWFSGDLVYFFSTLLKLRDHVSKREELSKRIKARSEIAETSALVSTDTLREERNLMDAITPRKRNAFFIAILELAVSLRYVGAYRWLFKGSDMGDGLCGAIGVCSSSLILYEEILTGVRETAPEKDKED